MISRSKITVVNPSNDFPLKYLTNEKIPKIIENANKNIPQPVTICIGATVNDVILLIAYLKRDLNDHLDTPASLSCTSNSTYVVLNPTHDDNALKNICGDIAEFIPLSAEAKHDAGKIFRELKTFLHGRNVIFGQAWN